MKIDTVHDNELESIVSHSIDEILEQIPILTRLSGVVDSDNRCPDREVREKDLQELIFTLDHIAEMARKASNELSDLLD